MTAPHPWTEEKLARLQRGLKAGLSLGRLGRELGLSPTALRRKAESLQQGEKSSARAVCGKEPLPACHPYSWAIIALPGYPQPWGEAGRGEKSREGKTLQEVERKRFSNGANHVVKCKPSL